jgi:hypothetical protein
MDVRLYMLRIRNDITRETNGGSSYCWKDGKILS